MAYIVARFDPEGNTVYIIDIDAGVSVTNDAENVVRSMHNDYKNARVVYKDTMGEWGELHHLNGDFIGFGPHKGM